MFAKEAPSHIRSYQFQLSFKYPFCKRTLCHVELRYPHVMTICKLAKVN